MAGYLISETTREEREQIVNEALGITVGCDEVPQSMIDMYQPYVDGMVELKDINMQFKAGYVSGEEMPSPSGCGYARR